MIRITKSIISIFLLLSCFTTVVRAADFKPLPQWMKTAVFYQIYPQSFKDTNGDGIGDIQGIIEKLDYVKWLGCNVIWLNPCFESAFQDAGYDVIDFYKVAQRYGTNDDLKRLFNEAHKRNMKVCLDLVAGHTSIESSWFKTSQKNEKNAYSDRYIWTNDSTIKPEKFVSGKFERNGTYMKNFFDCQPALNYGYGQPDPKCPWEEPVTAEGPQSTRKELMNIMDYWMEMGCDGFRVDMAGSLVKKDPDLKETTNLWAEIRTHFQDKFPEGILLAEWGKPQQAIKVGFMMDFIIHLRNSGYDTMFFNKTGTYRRDTCYFDIKGNGSPDFFIKNLTTQLSAAGDDGYICIPTANHDFQRPCCGERNTVPQLKTVMTFLMTLPGIPLVYYGDEIGMRFIDGLPNKEGSQLTKGNRAGSRTPMQWDSSDNAGFSSGSSSSLYLPLDSLTDRPTVEQEKKDPSSLLLFTKELIALRGKYAALGNRGEIRFLQSKDNQYPLIYERRLGKEAFIIVINPSGKDVSVSLDYDKVVKRVIPILSCSKHKIIDYKNKQLKISAEPLYYGIYQIY